jgi:hypothetical protein
MTPRHLLMVAGLALASGLAWFGNRGDTSDLAEAVVRDGHRAAAPRPEPARAATGASALPILALADRAPVLAPSRDDRRRLFAAQTWAMPAAPAPVASTPPQAPAAPTLPFSYIGRQSQGGQVEVFLAEGDQVHVVRAHTLLENGYRVDAITPTAVSFTYLPMNATQQLSIGASD